MTIAVALSFAADDLWRQVDEVACFAKQTASVRSRRENRVGHGVVRLCRERLGETRRRLLFSSIPTGPMPGSPGEPGRELDRARGRRTGARGMRVNCSTERMDR